MSAKIRLKEGQIRYAQLQTKDKICANLIYRFKIIKKFNFNNKIHYAAIRLFPETKDIEFNSEALYMFDKDGWEVSIDDTFGRYFLTDSARIKQYQKL